MEIIRNIKGTKDKLPTETIQWRWLESKVHTFMETYGYGEIRTPVFENTELFKRGIGDETDIVSKEMYSWKDQGNTSLTLRPELTAPVVRSYIQNNLQSLGPITKLYYLDSLFRRERPQAGRQRQFHQFGVEAIGSEYPEQDAEVISIAYGFYKKLGLQNLSVRLNSIGSSKIRPKYLETLKKYLLSINEMFCDVCKIRLQKNALRMFDCKNIKCKTLLLDKAPKISEFLTDQDKNHYAALKNILIELNIPFNEDVGMVRGLDYYTRTTFEIASGNLGAQDALCGGGRYDNLIEQLGGKPTPAVGFAAGMERLLMVLDINDLPQMTPIDIYIINISENTVSSAIKIANNLRKIKNVSILMETMRRSLKAQLREANRQKSNYVIILGEEEKQKKIVQVKNMKTSKQIELEFDKIQDYFIKILSKK